MAATAIRLKDVENLPHTSPEQLSERFLFEQTQTRAHKRFGIAACVSNSASKDRNHRGNGIGKRSSNLADLRCRQQSCDVYLHAVVRKITNQGDCRFALGICN